MLHYYFAESLQPSFCVQYLYFSIGKPSQEYNIVSTKGFLKDFSSFRLF